MKYNIKKVLLSSFICVALMASLSIASFAADASEIVFGSSLTFNPSSSDLFANFKNLMPGESRTQDIKIENNSSDKTNFYLRIAASEQDKSLSAKQQDLVWDLIYNKINVKITDIKGNIIYQGGIGGKNVSKTPDDVTSGTFFLGEVAAKSDSNIKVSLTMDSSIGNEYQGLAGNVKWILIAEQNGDTTTITINDPNTPLAGLIGDGSGNGNSSSSKSGTKTGDTSQILMWSVITVIVLGALVFVIVKKRKSIKSDI